MYGEVVDFICRPHRDVYEPSDLAGGAAGRGRIGKVVFTVRSPNILSAWCRRGFLWTALSVHTCTIMSVYCHFMILYYCIHFLYHERLLYIHLCSQRDDFTVTNPRGFRVECSLFLPEPFDRVTETISTVICCHGNRYAYQRTHLIYHCGVVCDFLRVPDCHVSSRWPRPVLSFSPPTPTPVPPRPPSHPSSSRRQFADAIVPLFPAGLGVVTFDFAGSGISEGDYVSLGAYEVDDLAAVVTNLRRRPYLKTLGLWGRSMGAVTAILYAQRDPSIAGMVLDSPFARLTSLMREIARSEMSKLPKMLMGPALGLLRRSVRKKAKFDIKSIAPIEVVGATFIPALFAHGSGDTFIDPQHSKELHDAYSGDKNYITFEGDHNSERPAFFYASVSIFFANTLQLPTQHRVPAPMGRRDNVEGITTQTHTETRTRGGNGGGGGSPPSTRPPLVPAPLPSQAYEDEDEEDDYGEEDDEEDDEAYGGMSETHFALLLAQEEAELQAALQASMADVDLNGGHREG